MHHNRTFVSECLRRLFGHCFWNFGRLSFLKPILIGFTFKRRLLWTSLPKHSIRICICIWLADCKFKNAASPPELPYTQRAEFSVANAFLMFGGSVFKNCKWFSYLDNTGKLLCAWWVLAMPRYLRSRGEDVCKAAWESHATKWHQQISFMWISLQRPVSILVFPHLLYWVAVLWKMLKSFSSPIYTLPWLLLSPVFLLVCLPWHMVWQQCPHCCHSLRPRLPVPQTASPKVPELHRSCCPTAEGERMLWDVEELN